jgi:acyl carrier protein
VVVDRLYRVVAATFGVPTESMTDEFSPVHINNWDSLGHINLILALEAEFNITLSPDEAAEMLSVGLIRKVLRDKRVTSI